MHVQALVCALIDAKFMHSKDAQCNSVEPAKEEIVFNGNSYLYNQIDTQRREGLLIAWRLYQLTGITITVSAI